MNTNEQHLIHKRLRREEAVRDLRDGRKRRGGVHKDKRKDKDKYACRKGNW